MIDAGPSLQLAERLTAHDFAAYLTRAGWGVRPSRVDGTSIWSKSYPGVRVPVEFILPSGIGSSDEKRRIADALRTVAEVEGVDVERIAEEARRSMKAGLAAAAADERA